MSFDAEEIYNLLPAVHRTRDAAQGYPLRQLVEILAGQVAVLEENLEQLYDNHFVETAAPWALPYLGDLLGVRGLPAGSVAKSSRSEVGHTVAYRRRKGTAPMLESLAGDITGWPSRAVEYFERIAAAQSLNHLRPQCRSFASLRKASELEFAGTPFESFMRTVEVRRIESGRGKWNIPHVGLHLWRVQAFSRTGSPLVPVDELAPGDPLAAHRFRVHPFGIDMRLFVNPATEDEMTHLAEPINIPQPLTRRMMTGTAGATENAFPLATFYGPEASVWLLEFVDDDYSIIPAERVIVCDLSDALDAAGNLVWNHQQKAIPGEIALDPQLGRVVFGSAPADPKHPPCASFHYGFSFNLGGGEYSRIASTVAPAARVQVRPPEHSAVPSFDTLTEALTSLGNGGGTIEMTGSGRFVETLPDVTVNGVSVDVRAVNGSCPAVMLKPEVDGQPWTISGDVNGHVSISGLWIVGALRVAGNMNRFELNHCTLAPGYRVNAAGRIIFAPDGSLEINSRQTHVSIRNCILPPLRVGTDGVTTDLRNCIIDAGSEDQFALSNLTGDGPAGSWRLENCTIIGNVSVDVMELASNCIFLSESVYVRRRQKGCVRFSWLPASVETQTPGRYRCVPADDVADSDVRPQFTSLRFGDPAYGQLSRRSSETIRSGADDGAEIGAFHDLFQPQREAHLRARLTEYLRFGLEAGVFCES
jgi:hypothetical protein